jgi:hypothetical protein
MAAWGEFAFIVATASREAGTMDPDAYGAVILVVRQAPHVPWTVPNVYTVKIYTVKMYTPNGSIYCQNTV